MGFESQENFTPQENKGSNPEVVKGLESQGIPSLEDYDTELKNGIQMSLADSWPEYDGMTDDEKLMKWSEEDGPSKYFREILEEEGSKFIIKYNEDPEKMIGWLEKEIKKRTLH